MHETIKLWVNYLYLIEILDANNFFLLTNKKVQLKIWWQWNIEIIVIIIISYLQINQILALNNPFGHGMSLNKQTK